MNFHPSARHRIISLHTGLIAVVLGLSIGLTQGRCDAQMQPSIRSQLVQEIEASKTRLDPKGLPDIRKQAEATIAAYVDLEIYLRTVADDANREGWLEYFDFEPLAQAVQSDASTSTLGRNARELYRRLSRNLPGLERDAVVQLRESSERLFSAAFFDNREASVEQLQKQLDRLADILRAGDEARSPDDAVMVNYLLGFINASTLTPDLIPRLRLYVGQPNVRLHIGSMAIASIVNRPVFEANPSDECILGTRVISQTQLDGTLHAVLIPDNSLARIRLQFSANFSSQGSGYNRSVKVLNRSFGKVEAYRDLLLDQNGLEMNPVVSHADLDSHVLGVQHPLRIVRRIAAKKAAQQRPQTNQIAGQRLERRTANQFQQQSDDQITRGNLMPKAQVADVLTRLDLDQPAKHWSTTSDYLQLQLTSANSYQLTTAVAPPAVIPGYDAVIQFHESAIANPSAVALTNRVLDGGEIRQFIVGLFPPDATFPQETMDEDEASPLEDVEITFAAINPVVFEARDGLLKLGIRGTRFRGASGEVKRGLQVAAVYRPVRGSDGAVRLERVDDVEVTSTSDAGPRIRPLERAEITALGRQFEKVFPQRLLDFPTRSLNQTPSLFAKLGDKKVVAIRPRDGWMTIYID